MSPVSSFIIHDLCQNLSKKDNDVVLLNSSVVTSNITESWSLKPKIRIFQSQFPIKFSKFTQGVLSDTPHRKRLIVQDNFQLEEEGFIKGLSQVQSTIGKITSYKVRFLHLQRAVTEMLSLNRFLVSGFFRYIKFRLVISVLARVRASNI